MSANEGKGASEAKPRGKPESKSAPKSDNATAQSPTEGQPDASKAPNDQAAGYSRGERQKGVTDQYRKGWDSIFGKKR